MTDRVVVQLRVDAGRKARWEAAAGSLGLSEWLRRAGDAALEEREGPSPGRAPVSVSPAPRARRAQPPKPTVRRLTPSEILAEVRRAAGVASLDLARDAQPDPRRK